MTKPVRDKKYQHVCFEETWILKSLKNKKENPFNRQPLDVDQLEPDLTLQDEINTYVDDFCNRSQKSVMKICMRNSLFSHQAELKYLQDNRHQDPTIQHEYAKQFGLVVQ